MIVYLVTGSNMNYPTGGFYVQSIHSREDVASALADELNETQTGYGYVVHKWDVNQGTEKRRLWIVSEHPSRRGLQANRIRTWLAEPEHDVLKTLTYQSLLNAPAKVGGVWYVVVEAKHWSIAYDNARSLLSQHIDQQP